ncbi:MAG: transposase [Opitutales bacterium]|nr:transposase [Opitutales bacterium]
MSKERGKRYSEEEREELLQLFAQSGYSASRFCQEMGVCYATLKRWVGRESPRVNLIEVTTAALAHAATLRVRLPNGIECELGSNLSRSEVTDWIRDLKAC